VARLAALTVADLQDRWWNNYSGHDVGLHGGSFTYTGDSRVVFSLHRYRLVGGLPVSGTATWDGTASTMTVSLVVPGGRLHGHWDTRAVGAHGVLVGSLAGRPVRVSFPAP
jgi:hypothetical protein